MRVRWYGHFGEETINAPGTPLSRLPRVPSTKFFPILG
ncbi:hypothetical protein [Azospirillum melinis]